jgi:hypothetical protein
MNAKGNETQKERVTLGRHKHVPPFLYTSSFHLTIYEEMLI